MPLSTRVSGEPHAGAPRRNQDPRRGVVADRPRQHEARPRNEPTAIRIGDERHEAVLRRAEPRRVRRVANGEVACERHRRVVRRIGPGHRRRGVDGRVHADAGIRGARIEGRARIAGVLGDIALALETLVGQVVTMMNADATLDEIIHSVRVSDEVLAKPYMRPYYDEPEFVVRNIWRMYGGWYDGNPANLDPLPPVEVFSNNPKLKHLPDFEADA